MLGEEQVVPVVGPLSASLEGIKLFMKTLIDQKPWLYEPSLVPMPWREISIESLLRKGPQGQPKLRIGVLADDTIVRPHPPILRGIKTLVDKLKDHPDIEIVEFPAYKHDEAVRQVQCNGSISKLMQGIVADHSQPLLCRRRAGRTRGH